ncbi:MAG: hypothetical protein ACREBW_10120 [Candidatus Micrarchaeaceae archaeon]
MKRLTGLLLGAGASCEAGMPLLWELTAEIKTWLTAEKIRELNAGWRIQGSGYSDSVVDELVSVLERSDTHYEAVLGHMEAEFRRQRTLQQEYHGLYSWLVELVYQLLYWRQVNNNTFLSRRMPQYDGIRALAETTTPLWVFSLNHDVIVEMIAARLSIPLHSGFSGSVVTLPRRDASGRKKGEIRAEVLTNRDLEHGAMYFPNPSQPGIYLLKIHGALDVFTFNDGQDLLKLLPNTSGLEGVIDVLRAANEDLFYPLPGAPGGRAKATNEIVYADDQGEMQFLRRSLLAGAFKFDVRSSQVLPKSLLKHFRQNLNFVSTLISIGYGFGDLHINAVLREWLEFLPDRRLEIVSPSAQDVPPFLLHLIPQVTIVRSSTTDYLDSRAGIIRAPCEKMEKHLVAILRALGKKQVKKAFASFLCQNQERMSQGLLAKLKALPLVDGHPDFSGIGAPAEIAKQWAAELKLDQEELLNRLLAHFEAIGKK